MLASASTTDVDTAPAPRHEVRVPTSDVHDDVAFEVAASGDATTSTTTQRAASSEDGSRSASDWPPPKDAPASQEGCDVEAGGTGVRTPVGAAAGSDDVDADRCGYVARQRGGYRGTGTWLVTIDRDGEKTTYSHHLGSPPCADDVIRPGDIVTAQ